MSRAHHGMSGWMICQFRQPSHRQATGNAAFECRLPAQNLPGKELEEHARIGF